MPLDGKRSRRSFDRLDHSIWRITDRPERTAEALDGLMMLTVYHEMLMSKDFNEFGPLIKVKGVHRMAPRLVILCTTHLLLKILIKSAAVNHIQELQPVADTKNRQFQVLCHSVELHIKSDPASIHRLDLVPIPLAIETRRNVGTSDNEEAVDRSEELHHIPWIVINRKHEWNSASP